MFDAPKYEPSIGDLVQTLNELQHKLRDIKYKIHKRQGYKLSGVLKRNGVYRILDENYSLSMKRYVVNNHQMMVVYGNVISPAISQDYVDVTFIDAEEEMSIKFQAIRERLPDED